MLFIFRALPPYLNKNPLVLLRKKIGKYKSSVLRIVHYLEPFHSSRPQYHTSTSVKTSFTRFNSRKTHYVSMGNSNASAIYPGRMSQKDRRLLKMILVIFVSFVLCYLPITLTKIWKATSDSHAFNIAGYVLIYLTTCINPLIYVLMSLEYRQAYWNLLRCQNSDTKSISSKTKSDRMAKT